MSTFSSNTTLKVAAAVSASAGGNGTLYTCPANRYAVCNLWLNSSSNIEVNVGGVLAAQVSSAIAATTGLQHQFQIYVGPGQVVEIVNESGSSIASLSGVEFANSP